ncbi:jg11751 [Pararge aegeria aegeria]|uniref:Jg11751 protein n=1 Tax=Pararge aegeria aegeria TaxID=348720 RepID=A0A8S4RZM1_9NEOP|nr:jg11751 [Pararge aegeria aegeria]
MSCVEDRAEYSSHGCPTRRVRDYNCTERVAATSTIYYVHEPVLLLFICTPNEVKELYKKKETYKKNQKVALSLSSDLCKATFTLKEQTTGKRKTKKCEPSRDAWQM